MDSGIYHVTTTGNTEPAAEGVKDLMPGDTIGIHEIGEADLSDLITHDGLIVGFLTWHTGADTERSGTAWDEFIYGDLTGLDLKGKKVAVFGVGDQAGYCDNFCDAMEEMASCFSAQGAEIVGAWSTDGYDHTESKSDTGGKFIGLACDEDNQPEMSEDRVKAWLEQIKGEGLAY